MFEFRPMDKDPEERLDHRERRTHLLSWKEELGWHWWIGDGPKWEITYYPREMYEPMQVIKKRVVLCLQWKWAENFAPSRHPRASESIA
jgi:hypothetical protein